MFFKLTSRNPYRDLVRNARRISIAELSNKEKSEAFQELWTLLQPKLKENQQLLNQEASYAKRCVHWNQLNIPSISPVTNVKNPWLRFKREFEAALAAPQDIQWRSVSTSLSWLYAHPHKEDWIE